MLVSLFAVRRQRSIVRTPASAPHQPPLGSLPLPPSLHSLQPQARCAYCVSSEAPIAVFQSFWILASGASTARPAPLAGSGPAQGLWLWNTEPRIPVQYCPALANISSAFSLTAPLMLTVIAAL